VLYQNEIEVLFPNAIMQGSYTGVFGHRLVVPNDQGSTTIDIIGDYEYLLNNGSDLSAVLSAIFSGSEIISIFNGVNDTGQNIDRLVIFVTDNERKVGRER
jgi:hypothetical protein